MPQFPDGFEDFHAANMEFLEITIQRIREPGFTESRSTERGRQNLAQMMAAQKRMPYELWLRPQMRKIFAGKKFDRQHFTQDDRMLKAMAGLFLRLYETELKQLPPLERLWQSLMYNRS